MRRWYGAGPLHLVSVLACFAVSGYAVLRVADALAAGTMGIWFAGAIIAHDLVLYPLCAFLDDGLSRLSRWRDGAPPLINFVRVPAVLSGFVLLVAFPLVFRLNSTTYTAASGRSPRPYLGRWLMFAAVVHAVSALLYVWRLFRARRAGQYDSRG